MFSTTIYLDLIKVITGKTKGFINWNPIHLKVEEEHYLPTCMETINSKITIKAVLA